MRMIFHRLTTAALLGLLAVSGVSHAKTYKWVDAHGGIHYTQIPPVDQQARILEVRGGDPAKPASQKPQTSPETTDENSDDEPAQYRTLKVDPEDEKAAKRAEALRKKQQQEACDALRNNLKILEQNTRIRIRSGENGEPRVLTPEEREARIREYSEDIDKMCQ